MKAMNMDEIIAWFITFLGARGLTLEAEDEKLLETARSFNGNDRTRRALIVVAHMIIAVKKNAPAEIKTEFNSMLTDVNVPAALGWPRLDGAEDLYYLHGRCMSIANTAISLVSSDQRTVTSGIVL